MLFLLKIALPAILVAAISLASRWWGPTIGGMLLGLPWMTGPILFFLTLDRGEAFGVGATVGIELGVVCISAYMLAYGVMTIFAPWPVCLVAAGAAFVATAWALQDLAVPLVEAAALAAAALLATYALLPRPRTAATSAQLPWWDIPVRMATTLALVAVIMLTADALGPGLSGIVSTFPVMVSVIGAFTQQQWGRDAVRRVLRGVTQSLLAFVAFFLALGTSLPAVGLPLSFVLGTAAALPVSALLLAINRRRLA